MLRILILLVLLIPGCRPGLGGGLAPQALPEAALTREPELAGRWKTPAPVRWIEPLRGVLVLVTTHGGEVYLWDLEAGRRQGRTWRPFRDRISSQYLDRREGVLYLASREKGQLRAYDLEHNRLRWKQAVDSVEGNLLVREDRLYLAQTSSTVLALDLVGGQVLATWRLKGRPLRGVQGWGQDLVVVTDRGRVALLSAGRDPWQEWDLELESDPALTAAGGRVCLVDSRGRIIVLEKGNQDRLLNLALEEPIYSAPYFYDNHLVVAGAGGVVVGISLPEGRVAWRYQGPGLVNQPLVGHRNTCLIPYARGALVALDVVTGEETWRYDLEHRLELCRLVPGGILVVDARKTMLYLKTES